MRNDPATFINGIATQLNQVNRLEPLGQDPANVLDAPAGRPTLAQRPIDRAGWRLRRKPEQRQLP